MSATPLDRASPAAASPPGDDEAQAARRAILEGPQGPFLRVKVAVYRALYPQEGDSRWLDSAIITLIALNVLAVILETEEAYNAPYHIGFVVFEWFSSLVFTIEYVARLWVVDLEYDPRRPWRSRARYIFSFMALVDLVAILPFYLPMLITLDLRFVRAIRLLRLFRILKTGRYAHAVRTVAGVFSRKKEELAMTTFILVLLLVLSASAMYFVEHQPLVETLADGTVVQRQDPNDPFRSIPAAMWWAVITLTSVGYGDVVPQSVMGKFVAAVVSLVGVGFVALPTGILAAGFAEEIREQRLRGGKLDLPGYCPHCGEPVVPEADYD
jgi:voltage-gated potassium channel